MAFDDLRAWLDRNDIPAKAHFSAELVFEEVVTNIVKYGFEEPAGQTVEVELSHDQAVLVMVFVDSGYAFDPLQKEDPVLPASIEEAKIGGLGLMLVRKASRALSYERTDEGQNRFTVELATA